MRHLVKNPFERKQKSAVITLCIVCALFFMAVGCERQKTPPKANSEEPSTSEVDENTDGEIIVKENYSFYFYHEGEKVNLALNTKYAFLSLKEPQLPVDIIQRGISAEEFIPDNYDKKEYKGKPGVLRYYAELNIENNLTEGQYLELLSDIKQKNRDVIIAPYFTFTYPDYPDNPIKKVGLSHTFYVETGNVELLEQMAEQTGSVIVEQFESLPTWYLLTVTEAAELNTLEIVNFFLDEGLFTAAQAPFWAYKESIAQPINP